MAKYIINYELRNKEKNYEPLYKALKSYESIHPLETCWVVKSSVSETIIRDHLEPYIDHGDKLFIFELKDWASLNINGVDVNWLKHA